MTFPHVITYILTVVCIPIVAALLAGHDPMQAYAELFGFLSRAAALGVRIGS